MLALKFYKMRPGGNVTILIEDQGFNQAERSRISAQLMDSQHLYAEQVGFIDFAKPAVTGAAVDRYPRLEMMGGEFCGNACRSFGALLAFNDQLERRSCQKQNGQASLHGYISSSGLTQPVELRASLALVPDARTTSGAAEEQVFSGKVNLADRPISAKVGVGVPLSNAESACTEIVELVPGAHLIHLSGISHLLLDKRLHHERGDLLLQATQWRARFSLSVHDAVGVIWYDRQRPAITPVVWVKAMRSAHLESACGSGSLALALLLQRLRAGTGAEAALPAVCGLLGDVQALQVAVMQPSGNYIEISLPADLTQSPAWMDGPVDMIATGEVFVDPQANS